MSLRNRFRLLLAIFGISVVANVLVSVWCIHIYVGEAIGSFETLTVSQRGANRAIRLTEELAAELESRPGREVRDTRYQMLARQIVQALDELPGGQSDAAGVEGRAELRARAEALSDSAERYVLLVDGGELGQGRTLLAEQVIARGVAPLQEALARCALYSDTQLTQTSASIGKKEASVTTVLSANAVAAFLLAAMGVHLVRNWVLKPIASLTRAAEEHAAGRLEYRIADIPRDELGTLSREVNRMADCLLEIQQRLIEQERMAAIGEVTSTVAHNIRNPLAGIRASAQSSLGELPPASDLGARLASIVKTVDSLNRWLRELLQVSQPIELECRPTEVGEVIRRVTEVLQSNAERRDIRFVVRQAPDHLAARIDAPRVEQMLLTIVANALEASPAGEAVTIEATRPGDAPSYVELRVQDRGPGIEPAVLERIASAYFSTKPGGTGIGLYLAKRVVRAHGGNLTFENNADQGTTVAVRLPAADEEDSGVIS